MALFVVKRPIPEHLPAIDAARKDELVKPDPQLGGPVSFRSPLKMPGARRTDPLQFDSAPAVHAWIKWANSCDNSTLLLARLLASFQRTTGNSTRRKRSYGASGPIDPRVHTSTFKVKWENPGPARLVRSLLFSFIPICLRIFLYDVTLSAARHYERSISFLTAMPLERIMSFLPNHVISSATRNLRNNGRRRILARQSVALR